MSRAANDAPSVRSLFLSPLAGRSSPYVIVGRRRTARPRTELARRPTWLKRSDRLKSVETSKNTNTPRRCNTPMTDVTASSPLSRRSSSPWSRSSLRIRDNVVGEVEHGVAPLTFRGATAARSEANRANRCRRRGNFDALTFNAWFTAYADGNERGMRSAAKRFRPEFQVAFDAWQKTDPESNPRACGVPEVDRAADQPVCAVETGSIASLLPLES